MAKGGGDGAPAPPAPRIEMAFATLVAVAGFGAAVLKGVAMSARYDLGVSPEWRARWENLEHALGGGAPGYGAWYGGSGSNADRGLVGRWLPGLTEGWLMGRRNDLSDSQWRTFRGNLPKLALVVLATVPIVTAIRRCLPRRFSAPFHALYGAAFIFYLHGFRVLWVAALALVHFAVCRAFAGVPRAGTAWHVLLATSSTRNVSPPILGSMAS